MPRAHKGVASHENRPVLRQGATIDDRPRPTSATESATGLSPEDLDLAIVVGAWSDVPEPVRARIVAMVKGARNYPNP
jgi:hypothetical protein